MPLPGAQTWPAQADVREVEVIEGARWGWLPALSLAAAAGLLLVSIADALSRSGRGQGEGLFWVGVLLVVAPFTIRLGSAGPRRTERLGLVSVFGLALYLVKVMHSPFAFTFSDELLHLYNLNTILRTGALFGANSVLPVSAYYPGLETVTAALASLGRMDAFGAGLVVVGVARLILQLALFLLYERLSGSARVAGLATLLYSANPNFLFWSAQYAYESLALPLATLVLFAAVYRDQTRDKKISLSLTLFAVLGIVVGVVTHHLTSYFLAALLLGWTVLQYALQRLAARNEKDEPAGNGWRYKASGPGRLALLAAFLPLVWLASVASPTIPYLLIPLRRAGVSLIEMATGAGILRPFFQSTSGYVAPFWERGIGIGSVLLCLLGALVGLRVVWQHYRRHAVVLMSAVAALGYFGTVVLRLSPTAWEIGNRASEFLFVGLALILSFAAAELWPSHQLGLWRQALLAGCVAVIFMGGVIAGWPPELRLAQPYLVATGTKTIESQGISVARWARVYLGPGYTVATDPSNAGLQLVYGEQFALTGRTYTIEQMLLDTPLKAWEIDAMRASGVQYIVMDRRLVSWDSMRGLYFDRVDNGGLPAPALWNPAVYEKFDSLPQVSRLADAGNIVVYDVRILANVP